MSKNMTPMMTQYMAIKEQYQDAILFFRLGDFYEMFFEDALVASKILEITLTGRNQAKEEKAPMCGVPYHAAEGYIQKLIAAGKKVAICEQVEAVGVSKGIVKRDVVRVVTPGTTLNTQSLQAHENQYLMCVYQNMAQYGLAFVDITTGDFYTTQVTGSKSVIDEVMKLSPSEIIVNDTIVQNLKLYETFKDHMQIYTNPYKAVAFRLDRAQEVLQKQFQVGSLLALGLEDFKEATLASGALLAYLYETQKNDLQHLKTLTYYETKAFMVLDGATRRNLELIETMRTKERKGTLMWVLDHTKTAMGARALRHMIEQPLIDPSAIVTRQAGVTALVEETLLRGTLREQLDPVYDFERLISKLALGTANGRDLTALKQSLEVLPDIKISMHQVKAPIFESMVTTFDALEDLYVWLDEALEAEPPITLKEGGLIKAPFHPDVKALRKAAFEGKQWLAELEQTERQATGIKNLKIKYNKVFGYYIEVTKSYLHLVPDHYQRKQTTTNAERYITDDLKEMENTLLGAKDRLAELEYELFVDLRERLLGQVGRIKTTAGHVAQLDALVSLAEAAYRNGYVCPVISETPVIDIIDGRHPVIEHMIDHDLFVSNDTYLDPHEHRFAVITGPNMAGKSTYMRQVALITLMAQIGSFVPAGSATIGPVDRIFTRVGASDDLAMGQSTFMVEMTEVANILRNATKNSLIILDEIGRGTSTFDGLSIAWSVVEHIARDIGAKTLFATHYHELTELEGLLEGVQNYFIDVKEQGEDILFLRKIIKGGANRSYGIQVAKLAGVPRPVLNRAMTLLEALNDSDINKQGQVARIRQQAPKVQEAPLQLNFFEPENHPVVAALKDLDVNQMTPMDALLWLNAKKKEL